MDNGDSVVRNTTYRYDNLQHRQLTSTKSTRSDGRTNTTSYKYLLDYPTTERNAALNLMETKFMHAIPLQVSVTEDQSSTTGKLVQRDFNIYDIFNITGGQAVLLRHKYELQTKDSLPVNSTYRYVPNLAPDSSIFRKAISFGYDERGNINLVQKANDMPVTYLWAMTKIFLLPRLKMQEVLRCTTIPLSQMKVHCLPMRKRDIRSSQEVRFNSQAFRHLIQRKL